MSAERVLALLPAYNPDPGDFDKSMRSLMTQTHEVDILVIDDGSNEPVAPLCPDVPCIQVLRLEKNVGIARALIAGVEYGLARDYDYLCRLDVGDISYPQRIARQLAHMRTNPQIDLVGAHSLVVDLQGRELFVHGISGGPKAVKDYLWRNSPFKHPTFFIRTTAVAQYGNYDTNFNDCEDYELMLRFARRGTVDCLTDVLIEYVDSPTGISTRRRTQQLCARLKAQLRHADPLAPGWYLGVSRTLGLMVTPYGWAKRASLARWRLATKRTTV